MVTLIFNYKINYTNIRLLIIQIQIILNMNKMKIEIWSDIACPYCYIGKRKLEKALVQFQHADKVQIVWRSYVLDPLLPKDKNEKSYYQYLASMNNYTEDEAKEQFDEINKLAATEGLNFAPEEIQITNTTDALRLIKLSNKYNVANEAEEALFCAYFIEGKNISDKNTLISIGFKLGIPGADITRCLDSFEYSEDIKNDIIEAEKKHDLEYVPFYLLNNKFVIQGSVSVEDYLKVLNEAYEDWTKNGWSKSGKTEDSIKGKSCSIDGTCSL